MSETTISELRRGIINKHEKRQRWEKLLAGRVCYVTKPENWTIAPSADNPKVGEMTVKANGAWEFTKYSKHEAVFSGDLKGLEDIRNQMMGGHGKFLDVYSDKKNEIVAYELGGTLVLCGGLSSEDSRKDTVKAISPRMKKILNTKLKAFTPGSTPAWNFFDNVLVYAHCHQKLFIVR